MIESLPESFDIAEVARRTGLTSRALRFYESRGLVQPLRSASGRRYYGAAELERIHQILALKRAGLTLAQIQRLTGNRKIDLADLVSTQLAILDNQSREINAAKRLLLSIQSRIERSEPIDAATFCSLIQQGEKMMNKEYEAWAGVWDRFLSGEAQSDFKQAMSRMECGTDFEAQGEQWKELGSRIKAAMPMKPDSEEALSFVREWFTLLAPFSAVATPAMWEGARNMYANMEDWQGGDADPGFDASVFTFIQEATTIARAAGKDIGPVPAWMKDQIKE